MQPVHLALVAFKQHALFTNEAGQPFALGALDFAASPTQAGNAPMISATTVSVSKYPEEPD